MEPNLPRIFNFFSLHKKRLVLDFVPVLMLPCVYWSHDMPCAAIFTFFVLPNIAVWLHRSLISFVKMITDFFQRRLHKAFDVIDHQILGKDDSRLNWNNHISSTAWRIYLKLNRAWDFKFSAVSSGILALKIWYPSLKISIPHLDSRYSNKQYPNKVNFYLTQHYLYILH